MKNIFDPEVHEQTIQRIQSLTPESTPKWGKMSVDQMLAHCCVPYEMAYTDKHPKPNAFMRFLLKTIVKKGVVNEKPYPKNARTAPAFIISERKDFDYEKNRLIAFIQKTFDYGSNYFDGKESLSFGPMSSQEWNNQFYKHLDHHLTQFGV
ncbi:DUF1569 domain-containing protein [Algoriphagus halophytocola]|uniref:DUF1569 domain-containing protein n=1 Tax=Algoriphagus halophytocola TaxID=2991499 RepID=A0ABY6MCT4_9BACT|nr:MULTISPECIES: DUF1569 domain-containing protein [unclassified Algoriphagus]UZD21522.1 DUF1569 domain-containing protein [Algoriphagus sp. TR-M5]WBL42734.1 DUF1569 domain-containing protein [Algoriphagus sp. TR-M9]